MKRAVKMNGFGLAACVVILGLLAASTQGGVSIGFDFSSGSTNSPVALMAATETAGAPGYQQANWNSPSAATGATGSVPGLIDSTGGTTGVLINWNGASTYTTNTSADTPGDYRMMKGYLDTATVSGNTRSTTSTVTVSNIAYGSYAVVVYIDGRNAGNNRIGEYIIKDSTGAATLAGPIFNLDASGANFAGTYIQSTSTTQAGATTGGNYIVFAGLTGSSFRLEATGVNNTNPRAPINGIQVVSLSSQAALNPTPLSGASNVPINQILSWDAPNDPNIAEVRNYAVYLSTDQGTVGSSLVKTGTVETFYDQVADYANDTTYYWRVDTTIKLDYKTDPNVIVGSVWSFKTIPSYFAPVITNFNSVITTLDLLPATVSATISGNSIPLTSVSMILLTDDVDFPVGANASFTGNTGTLAAPTGSLMTDTAGKYKIKLTATDGITTKEAFAEVVVYADACAAKKAAPSGWTADYYDRDNNCIVNLVDFALLAAKWVNDNSMKASETYAGSVLYIPQTVFDARIEVETYDPNNPDPNSVSNYPITDTNGIRITDGVLGYTGVGSFIEYMINIPAAGTYDLYIKSSANASGAILNFGTQATANLYGSTTAYTAKGWNNYTMQKYPGALTFTAAGLTKVRITWAGAAMNLDWFSIDLQP